MERLSFLVAIGISTLAQAQIPNTDFEQWQYTSGRPEPTGWITYNNFTNNVYHVVPVVPGHDSDTALNSRTIYTGISVFPGYAEATFPQTSRPIGLAWYSKHVRMTGDTVRITCTLDPGATPLGVLRWDPVNDQDSNDFVFNYVPITYNGPSNPTQAKITIEGGDDNISQTGTWLIVDKIHFCDSPPPSGTLIISGPASAHDGDTLVFTLDGVPGATDYAWEFPGDVIVLSGTGTDSIIVIWGATGGDVMATSSNACGPGPSASVTIDLIAGTRDVPKQTLLTVWPNPTSTSISVMITGQSQRLMISDNTGRVRSVHLVKDGDNTIALDHLETGIYLVRLADQTTRLIVNNLKH